MKLRLLVFLCLSLSLIFLFVPGKANAQLQNSSPSAYQNYVNADPDVPQTLHTYTQGVFFEIASTISCQLTGYDPTNPNQKCLGINSETGKIGFVENGGGAIGIVGSFIASTFYFPVNTHDYVSNVAANFGMAHKTYAADTGIGFNSLIPTLKLWQAFRNITYMLFVLLFVIVGVGIMLRIKIDPRTVMSIQNQIPKIIMAIVFVTLSYAIAGFLIDLMYVVIYLIMSIFTSAGIDATGSIASNPFTAIGGFGVNVGGSGPGGLIPAVHMSGISGIAENVAQSISGIASDIFGGILGKTVQAMILGLIGNLLPNPADGVPILGGVVKTAEVLGLGGLGFIAPNLGGKQIAGFLVGIIVYLVIIIAIFSALLRLWFVLIKSYINVLVAVVLGPFLIALGLIPGRSGLGNWVKSIVANLAVFPVTIAIFLLGKAFMYGFTSPPAGTRPFAPPLVGDFTNPERMAAIIGLAIILMAPEVANMVRDTLKAPDFKYLSAVGRGLAVGQGSVGALIGKPYEKLMERNRQTGKAEGWLARRIFGKNPLTRTLFNTNDYRSTQQKQMDQSRKIERDRLRREGAGRIGSFFRQANIENQRNRFNSGRQANRPEGTEGPELPPNNEPPTTPPPTPPPTTPPPAPTEEAERDETNIEPADTDQDTANENATSNLSALERLVNQTRESLSEQGLNNESINRVLSSQFGEEMTTDDLEQLRRIADERRSEIRDITGNSEEERNRKASLENRLARIEEKIRRLS